MTITFTAKTYADSENYLLIGYRGNRYKLGEFASNFKVEGSAYQLDELFEECTLIYNDEEFSISQYHEEISNFSNRLIFSQQYINRIYPYEMPHIFLINKDYFAAGRLIKSAEDQLSFGRMALLRSFVKLDFNININWKTGYGPIYYIRCVNASNAIIWYNNIFDYLMQIIFIAFGIYRFHPDFNEELEFHKILKLCDYKYLSQFYGSNKTVQNFKELWKLLSVAQASNTKINEWANFIKHKGGIDYIGSTPASPYRIELTLNTGDKISDLDFNPPQVQLEDVLSELANHHIVLCSTLAKIVDFMKFDAVRLEQNENGYVIPNESNYKKLIFSAEI